jgi:glucose-1-phosphate cytidylyltransferase
VVILAGGYGTRLAEQTDEIPKPMVQVGGRPILWHILKIYSHFGFNDFLIAAGYKSEAIKRFFLEYREQMSDLVFDFANDRVERINGKIEPWRIAVLDTGPQTMTGGRIKRLAAHVGHGTFLMTYGDGVANINLAALLKFHQSHGKLATFTVVRNPTPFGIPTLQGDRVLRFAEKQSDHDDWINGGFFVLNSGVFPYISDDSTSFEFHSLDRLAQDDQLRAYRHEGFWHPMDTLRDVRKLNTLWNERQAPWKVWT